MKALVPVSELLEIAEYLLSQRLADPFDAELIRCIEIVDAAVHRAANPPPVHHLRVVPPASPQGASAAR
jgi:hypothetical protein